MRTYRRVGKPLAVATAVAFLPPNYEADLEFERRQKSYELAEAKQKEAFDRSRHEGINEHNLELYRRAWDDLDAAADAVIAYCNNEAAAIKRDTLARLRSVILCRDTSRGS